MMDFIIGGLVGFLIAAAIGRVKFLQVQNKLREVRAGLVAALTKERNLSEGLAQELADRTR